MSTDTAFRDVPLGSGACTVCDELVPYAMSKARVGQPMPLRIHGPKRTRCPGGGHPGKTWAESSRLPAWDDLTDLDKGAALLHVWKVECGCSDYGDPWTDEDDRFIRAAMTASVEVAKYVPRRAPRPVGWTSVPVSGAHPAEAVAQAVRNAAVDVLQRVWGLDHDVAWGYANSIARHQELAALSASESADDGAAS